LAGKQHLVKKNGKPQELAIFVKTSLSVINDHRQQMYQKTKGRNSPNPEPS